MIWFLMKISKTEVAVESRVEKLILNDNTLIFIICINDLK